MGDIETECFGCFEMMIRAALILLTSGLQVGLPESDWPLFDHFVSAQQRWRRGRPDGLRRPLWARYVPPVVREMKHTTNSLAVSGNHRPSLTSVSIS